jgi:pimeloyl-ACP methyl ester carboxylesterase
VRAAYDTWAERLAFSVLHAGRVIAAPMIPSRMAARVTLQQAIDFAPDCARIHVPTLVITGDDPLDQVVPPAVSRRYLDLIPGAQYEKMERTGHIGMVTRPKHFADVVTRFLGSSPDQN